MHDNAKFPIVLLNVREESGEERLKVSTTSYGWMPVCVLNIWSQWTLLTLWFTLLFSSTIYREINKHLIIIRRYRSFRFEKNGSYWTRPFWIPATSRRSNDLLLIYWFSIKLKRLFATTKKYWECLKTT